MSWVSIPVIVTSARDLTGQDISRLNGGLAQLMRQGSHGEAQVRDFLRDTLIDTDDIEISRADSHDAPKPEEGV